MSRDNGFDDDMERELEDDLDEEIEDDEDDDDDDDDKASGSTRSNDDEDGEGRDDDLNDDSSERRNRGRSNRKRDDSSADDNSVDSVTGEGRDRRGYTFELASDGNVINVRRIKEGRSKAERLEAGETWSFDSASKALIFTETYSNGSEVKTYTDDNNDGIFTRSRESLTPFDSSQAGNIV